MATMKIDEVRAVFVRAGVEVHDNGMIRYQGKKTHLPKCKEIDDNLLGQVLRKLEFPRKNFRAAQATPRG